MKSILIMISTLLLAACGAASSDQNSASQRPAQSRATAASTETGSYEVKVTRDGKAVASYSQTVARPTALFDDGSIMIFLGSPDNKHILTVTLQAAMAGAYPLAPEADAPKQNEAKLEFMTEIADPPMVLIASNGELKMDKFDQKYCSGSFIVAGTDVRGVKFTIEGSFSNIGVKKPAEK